MRENCLLSTFLSADKPHKMLGVCVRLRIYQWHDFDTSDYSDDKSPQLQLFCDEPRPMEIRTFLRKWRVNLDYVYPNAKCSCGHGRPRSCARYRVKIIKWLISDFVKLNKKCVCVSIIHHEKYNMCIISVTIFPFSRFYFITLLSFMKLSRGNPTKLWE